MSDKTPIEETFRNAFDNFEADVSAKVWSNIEQQIASPVAPAGGNSAIGSGKSLLSAGKFSSLTYGIASTIVVALFVAGYFYFTAENKIVLSKTNQPNSVLPNSVLIRDAKSTEQTFTSEAKHENNFSSPITVTKNAAKQAEDNSAKGSTTVYPGKTLEQTITKTDLLTSDDKTVKNQETPVIPAPVVSQETKTQPSADEKHEIKSAEEPETPNKLPLEKPTQSDDFEWGVIANSISPNNDGKNDVFEIKTPGLNTLKVTIFDHRNGKTIYSWNTINGSWDGKDFSGKEMPAGFYLYYIFAESKDGKPHTKKGSLYIFR